MIRRIFAILLCLCLLHTLFPVAYAADSLAADISAETTISGTGYTDFGFLTDKNTGNYRTSSQSASITLENTAGIYSLYLLFNLEYGAYTVLNNDTGAAITAGEYGFLHEYIDLASAFSAAPTSITVQFTNGKVSLSEIYAFSAGQTPDFVQKWQPPYEGNTDILLLSTHGDDEQLYFAGLLPYYAVYRDVHVQVAYLTDHRNTTMGRTHEMLNGLWGVGVRAYPVFGTFRDMRIDDLNSIYARYRDFGVTKDDFLEFVTEQLRRFKPKVVVGHDINGEYGHGMHKIYTDCLMDVLDHTSDPTYFPASAEKYGVWDVPKAYLHLYNENPIVMDYDQPLEVFDGLSAFQVTQKYGFSCHISQHVHGFYAWLHGKNGEITKASQISRYSPCKFGLYRSTVGPDVAKNDFLENIVTYVEIEKAEQERLEQERLEQERLEQERLEQERLEQERLEQQRLEQERLEQERLEQERILAQKKAQRRQTIKTVALTIAIVCGSLALILAVYLVLRKRSSKKKKSVIKRK